MDCLDRMWGGELFVPKIPSYKILDVAAAIAPEAKIEIVGIRPGEKLHEEMITETDALATAEFDNYYVILPSLPLWNIERFVAESGNGNGRMVADGFAYNSGTNDTFLTQSQIKELIGTDVEI
jgi:FlaA1/EpsC-like NDP-sugar epimerase